MREVFPGAREGHQQSLKGLSRKVGDYIVANPSITYSGFSGSSGKGVNQNFFRMFPPRNVNLFRYKLYRLFLQLKETNRKSEFLSVLSGALEARGQNLQVNIVSGHVLGNS